MLLIAFIKSFVKTCYTLGNIVKACKYYAFLYPNFSCFVGTKSNYTIMFDLITGMQQDGVFTTKAEKLKLILKPALKKLYIMIRVGSLLHRITGLCPKYCKNGHANTCTTNLELISPESLPKLSMYQVLAKDGCLLNPTYVPSIDKDTLMTMFKKMLTLSILDKIMYESQRQGRISFYITHYGEEATQMGSAAALSSVYGQYRELGVLLWRGYTLEEIIDQCCSNSGDINKGRQMPMHFGSKKLNFSTISSTLATQIPAAVGSAYAFKLNAQKKIVACYFGDGAASEGDAFTALNVSATLDCPIVFICRNNGFAISTPLHEQYRGDGIAIRAPALGLYGIRVDGNDVFAMYDAAKRAREIALTENKPVLIEAMTYRVGDHSTSDDSSVYRSADDVNYWITENNPILRLKNYLTNQGWISELDEKNMREEIRKEIIEQFSISEAKPKANPLFLFTDVYAKMSPRLRKQMVETKERIEKHKDKYNVSNFEPITDSN